MSALARARSLIAIGRYREALDALTPALADPAAGAEAHCLRAQCLLALGEPREAREAAEQALAIEAAEEWGHRLLALALLATHHPRKALRAAEEAVRLEPDSAHGLHVLALAQLTRGKTRDAQRTAGHALEANPHSELSHLTAGTVALDQGDWTGAEHHFRGGLAIAPDDTDLKIGLATALKHQRRKDEAAEVFLAAGREDPTDERVRHGLARIGAPLVAVGWFGKIVIINAATRLVENIGRPDVVALLFACVLALGALITVSMRVAGTRELPEAVRRGLRGEHINAGLNWLRAAAVIAAMIAIWAILADPSDGGGPALAVALCAFAAASWLLAEHFHHGPRTRWLKVLRRLRPRFR